MTPNYDILKNPEAMEQLQKKMRDRMYCVGGMFGPQAAAADPCDPALIQHVFGADATLNEVKTSEGVSGVIKSKRGIFAYSIK